MLFLNSVNHGIYKFNFPKKLNPIETFYKSQQNTTMDFIDQAQFMYVIEKSDLEIHFSNDEVVPGVVGETEEFGVLKLKMKKTEITKDPTLFLFTVDNTGSMEERDTSGKTKIEIVIQTLVNVLHYLSEQTADIFVRVHSFNHSVTIEIDTIKITKDNVGELTDKIRAIRAYGVTNMGNALQNANETLHDYLSENPRHQLCHIFMTDGYATTGVVDGQELTEFVSDSFGNVFVGFGDDHNASLLKSFSDVGSSAYQFVNDMENTSLIYGEALHRYLYPCVRKATLFVENGLIYNWKTNEWTNRLDEDILVSEIEKIYHVKKEKESHIAIDLHGIVANNSTVSRIETIVEIPHLITMETGDIVENDLTKYMFRHKTQELLFRSKNLDIEGDARRKLKNDLRQFFKKMRDYMRAKDILDDSFMKMLCDDVYITYTTMGQKQGQMFALARFTSQGRQQTYSATPRRPSEHSTEPIRYAVPMTPMKRRPGRFVRPQLNRSYTQMYDHMCEDEETKEDPEESASPQRERVPSEDLLSDEEDEEEFSSYILNLSTVQECYATPSALSTMSRVQAGNHSSPVTLSL